MGKWYKIFKIKNWYCPIKGGAAELVERSCSMPKVSGSKPREGEKNLKNHFECDFSATLSQVCIQHHAEQG